MFQFTFLFVNVCSFEHTKGIINIIIFINILIFLNTNFSIYLILLYSHRDKNYKSLKNAWTNEADWGMKTSWIFGKNMGLLRNRKRDLN